MCGIFGFVSRTDRPMTEVIDGLKELEYRGYDSWGVAVAQGSEVLTDKQVGKIGSAVSELPPGRAALGHTRWATHGAVNWVNAHPHRDCTGTLAIIHNGIVENHQSIRSRLKGHEFHSETDTEVIAHLLEDELASANGNRSVVRGLMNAFAELQGLSAVAVLDAKTGEIAAVKSGSPLIIGLGETEAFLASDPVALLPHTRELIFVEDGQAVLLTQAGAEVFDAATGARIEPQVQTVDWTVHDHSLDEHQHYMQKEINEQPAILRHLSASKQREVEALADMVRNAGTVYVTGCGTAHHAGLAAQYLFSNVASKRLIPVLASEMAVAAPIIASNDLVVALSQSGETIDVLDAVRVAKTAGAQVAALTNSQGSTLSRASDLTILLDCGPERCVLATKTYTAKLAVLLMTAFELAGTPVEGRRAIAEGALLMEAQLVQEEEHEAIRALAKRLSGSSSIFVLGRHVAYPLALEAALKVKEVSYIHAEGFASGELKHGVIALIEQGTPCLVFAIDDEWMKPTLSGTAEVRARGAFTVGFSEKNQTEFDVHIPIRGRDGAAILELAAVFQMLAYYLALELDRDPDKPRNLAKSVTVR